jgi:O-antigen/teichoic acid export membrane protein|tara:strand:- start:18495 stop:19937 length:1443 start_codon:yes stop_codon:yes gene_type:complete
MGIARRIYKNTTYLGIAEIVSRVLQFVVMLYAARLLSQQNFGKFSFALSLSFMAVILADLGINTLLIREISRNKSLVSKYFINAFSIKIVLSIITFFIIVAVLNALNYPEITRQIVYIIWLFTILSTFTELFYSIFRAFEQMFYDAFLKILRMSILAVTGIYVLFKGYGVIIFSYTFVFTEIIVITLASLIALKKFIKLDIRIDPVFIKSTLKKALPFGLAFIFGSIYFFIGSIMLSKMKGDVEVAIFSAAYNIALALIFIPTVYINAIYPVLSRYYKEGKSGLRLLYERSFKYLYIIGLPISLGIFMLSDEIIGFLYGARYSISSIALRIISLYLFLKFINFLLGIVLSSIDKQNKRMLGQGITAGISILLNLLLIPLIGFVGAAISTLITEIFLFIIYYIFVSKSWYYYNFLGILPKPIIAVIIMSLFIGFTNLNLIITIIASAAIYLSVLMVLRTLDKKDYEIIRKIFKNEEQRGHN